MMLYREYPGASKRVMQIIEQAPRGFENWHRGAFVECEARLEAEGLVKRNGARFDVKEIPFLVNWGQP